MPFTGNTLVGYIYRHSDGTPLAGAVVRINGSSAGRPTWIQSTTAATDGRFELTLSRNRKLAYRLSVSQAGSALAIMGRDQFTGSEPPTPGTVFRVAAQVGRQIANDATPAVPGSGASVRGVVRHQNGQAIGSATVRVMSWVPGTETLVDETASDTDGSYTVSYTYPGTPPDLFVVVLDGDEAECGRSPMTYGAAHHIQVDVTVAGDTLWGKTAWERLDEAIADLLVGVDLADVGRRDLLRVAEKTGLPINQVRQYVRAKRIADELSPSPGAEALFGLLHGLPTAAPSVLASMPAGTVSKVLTAAASQHLVSDAVAADASATAADLLENAVAFVLDGGTAGTLGALLDAATTLSTPQKDLLARDALAYKNPAAFWSAVAAHSEFSEGEVTAAKRALALNMVAYSHLPLVIAFDSAYSTPAANKAAELTLSDWAALLDDLVGGVPVGAPASVEGATEEERREAYAALLLARAEAVWPSHAVASAYRRADPGDTTDLSKFFVQNPTFDIGTTAVATFMLGADLDDIVSVEDLTERLRLIQRLHRAVPLPDRYTAIAALEAEDFGSASRVARMSRTRFVERMATPLGGEDRARAVWARARHVANTAMDLYARFATWKQSSIARVAAPDYALAASAIEGFGAIFGSATCGCQSCLSVTSPAAYYADLLQWLDGIPMAVPSEGVESLYDHLTSRRPELGLLELSCANSETLIPYVDLAVEILEVAVYNNSFSPPVSLPVSTSRTTEELVAQPEHQHPLVYTTALHDAVWPLMMPYHHYLTQERVYLDFVGVSPVELLDIYRGSSGLTDEQIDIVRLNGSPNLAIILIDEVPADPHAYWGYETTTVQHPNPLYAEEPPVAWYVALRWVPEFLARAEIEKDGGPVLRDILHARFVQTPNAFDLVTRSDVELSCDLADYYLGTAYDEAGSVAGAFEFTRLGAFMRLARVTELSYLDLDKALWSFGVVPTATETSLDATQLRKFACLQRVRACVPDLDVARIASWWSTTNGTGPGTWYLIDTFLDVEGKVSPVRSLYDQLFLDPAVLSDPSTSPFLLNEARTQLATTDTTHSLVSAHETALLAAFRTTSSELLAAQTVVQVQLGTPTVLLDRTMDHVSRLYRVLSTSQASGLAVQEADAFRNALTAPYTSPESAALWFERLAELRKLSVSVSEVLYIGGHEAVATARLALPETSSREFLGALREELRGLASPAVEAVDNGMLQALLSTVVADPETIGLVIESVNGTYVVSDADDIVNGAVGSYLTVVELSPATLIPASLAVTDEEVQGARRLEFYVLLAARITAVRQRAAVVRAVSEEFGLAEDVVAPACDLTFDGLAGGSPVIVWTNSGFLEVSEGEDPAWADLTPASDPDAFRANDLLNKVCVLLAKWRLAPDMVSFWLAHVSSLGLLDASALPQAETLGDLTGESGNYEGLRSLGRLVALDRSKSEPSWASLLTDLEDLNVATFGGAIADRLGVEREVVDGYLLGSHTGGLRLTTSETLTGTTTTIDITLQGATVDASPPSGTWASTSAALEVLRTKINIDATLGPVVTATCLDASGAVAASGEAVAIRVDPDPALLDLIASSTTLDVALVLFSVDNLERLLRGVELATQVGASPTEMFTWATNDPGPAVTQGIRSAIRSKYTTAESWSAAWHPVRDKVRKVQQAALRSWVFGYVEAVPDGGFHLVDAQMDPMVMTTRLLNCTSAVQQYVQRVLLRLEAPEAVLDDDEVQQWEWMSTYRTWEAARKVFLYPELYAEPELRAGKTDLFEDVESAVQSVDINATTVTEAATTYADALLALANPLVAGMCLEAVRDQDANTADTLHIFAQPPTDPPDTYYRRFEHLATFTPWERVDLPISTRVVCPVVFKDRLVLFWLDLTTKPADPDSSSSGAANTAEVSISWSIYLAGGSWSTPQRGPSKSEADVADMNGGTAHDDRWSLYADRNGNRLVVRVVEDVAGAGGDIEEIFAEYELDGDTWLLNAVSPTHRNRSIVTAWCGLSDRQGYIVPAWTGTIGVPDDTLHMPVFAYRDLEPDPDYPYIMNEILPEGQPYYSTVLRIHPENGNLTVRVPRNGAKFVCEEPFTAQDSQRAYLIQKTSGEVNANTPTVAIAPGVNEVAAEFNVLTLHHPYASLISSALHRNGIEGLLNPRPHDHDFGSGELLFQEKTDLSTAWEDPPVDEMSAFEYHYKTDNIQPQAGEHPYPIDEFDFRVGSAQGVYNWELFFHLSTYLAQRLREQGTYDEALRWLKYIFDPTRDANPWRVKPLREAEEVETVADLMLAARDPLSPEAAEYVHQIEEWSKDPYNPHLICEMRPESYQRYAVMRYVETVLDWADQRFSQDTWEAVSGAFQLYLHAEQVLGPRPQTIEASTETVTQNFEQLKGSLDAFSNGLVALENLAGAGDGGSGVVVVQHVEPLSPAAFYFCVPRNDAIDLYWDRINDRLFKIRNSMDINGVVRSLALYPPPINPLLLVAASAAGADLGSVINANPAPPMYRFVTMIGRAKELAGAVAGLGGAMLAAMEKRDSEEMALMRESQDLTMGQLTLDVKAMQLAEAQASLAAAKQAKDVVKQRRDYYQGLLDKKLVPEEEKADRAFKTAGGFSVSSAAGKSVASGLALIPDIWPPESGGSFLAGSANSAAEGLGAFAAYFSHQESKHERKATRTRRTQDWKQQVASAKAELKQHDSLIESAQIRVDIAESEVANQQQQIAHTRQRGDFLKSKYTNKQLYSWMVGSVAQIHAQAYQLALEVARQAEACYRYELAVPTSSFVRWTNWDSLRKGLHAGERLTFDLHRMERAYYEADLRELHITKHVSLAAVDPVALLELREGRPCSFYLPEEIYDLDFPGHYLRRIKGVAISMPCVVAPTAGVNATLRLESTTTRISASTTPPYSEDSDGRFLRDLTIESIAVSGAQDETGVFNFSFDGPRFMPFERRGVVGNWSLAITSQYPSFDPRSISDVVLRIQYTARDGGALLAGAANTALAASLGGTGDPPPTLALSRSFSAKRDFPDAWHALLNPESGSGSDAVLGFNLERAHFPAPFHGAATIALGAYQVVITASPDATVAASMNASISLGTSAPGVVALNDATDPYALSVTATAGSLNTLNAANPARAFSMTIAAAALGSSGLSTGGLLDPDLVDDVYLVVHYTVSG